MGELNASRMVSVVRLRLPGPFVLVSVSTLLLRTLHHSSNSRSRVFCGGKVLRERSFCDVRSGDRAADGALSEIILGSDSSPSKGTYAGSVV